LSALPEVRPGDDLPGMLAARAAAEGVAPGDVLMVAQKVVSKAEDRVVVLDGVTPGAAALALAAETGKRPELCELILAESRRIVRRRGGTVICETHHGFVCANAGIDRSNAPGADMAILLPADPDASARALRAPLEQASGARLAVVIADTMGRPLRNGIVGTAIGVAGIAPLRGYQGAVDPAGYELRTTSVSVADELAAAADLVLGKLERVPAALVRGFAGGGDGTAAELIRPADRDLFL
jgi:coenzyme F420-0:L-glutamate ligase / coenzyme F420-1:gamma-L-glutamate ligase